MDTRKLQKNSVEILNKIIESVRNSEGSVKPQSLVCAVGAVSGYACRYDIIREYGVEKGLPEDSIFNVVFDKSGKKYFFGELLDNLLVKDKFSLWGFAGGAVAHLKAKLPDIEGILKYVSISAGKDNFGCVRSADTEKNPQEYLEKLWNFILPDAKKVCETGEIHILLGMCLQKSIVACSEAFNVTELCRIAMESGIICARAGKV